MHLLSVLYRHPYPSSMAGSSRLVLGQGVQVQETRRQGGRERWRGGGSMIRRSCRRHRSTFTRPTQRRGSINHGQCPWTNPCLLQSTMSLYHIRPIGGQAPCGHLGPHPSSNLQTKTKRRTSAPAPRWTLRTSLSRAPGLCRRTSGRQRSGRLHHRIPSQREMDSSVPRRSGRALFLQVLQAASACLRPICRIYLKVQHHRDHTRRTIPETMGMHGH